MEPDKPETSQGGMSLQGKGQFDGAPSDQGSDKSREAAANVIRNQIDNLYGQQPNLNSQLDTSNPYQRTHSGTTGKTPLTKDWNEYHSAWQSYYQKYYEGFYRQKHQQTNPASSNQYFNEQNTASDQTFSTNEAVFDLRQRLLSKVSASTKKVRKSRHFKPIIAGVIAMLIFIFLQYNSLIVANVLAYVSPGSIDPQNIVIDPSLDTTVSWEPKLIIPKINVDVPVIYDVGNDHDSQMTAMTNGVAHFSIPGASSHPGEIGNTVLSGHSSNDLFDSGDYKFIFAQLDKLVVGDTIYANYQSIRYTYIVTEKKVVKPTDVSALVYPTDKPILTLITCTPLGTSRNRLLVIAEQVSPDPSKAQAAPASSTTDNNQMPGNTPSLIERLFGAS